MSWDMGALPELPAVKCASTLRQKTHALLTNAISYKWSPEKYAILRFGRKPTPFGLLGKLSPELRLNIWKLLARRRRCDYNAPCAWAAKVGKHLTIMRASSAIYNEVQHELNHHAELDISPFQIPDYLLANLQRSKIEFLTVTIYPEPACWTRCNSTVEARTNCNSYSLSAKDKSYLLHKGLQCLQVNLRWLALIVIRLQLRRLAIKFANDARSLELFQVLNEIDDTDNRASQNDSERMSRFGMLMVKFADMLYGLQWFKHFSIALPPKMKPKVQLEKDYIEKGLKIFCNYAQTPVPATRLVLYANGKDGTFSRHMKLATPTGEIVREFFVFYNYHPCRFGKRFWVFPHYHEREIDTHYWQACQALELRRNDEHPKLEAWEINLALRHTKCRSDACVNNYSYTGVEQLFSRFTGYQEYYLAKAKPKGWTMPPLRVPSRLLYVL